MSVRSCFPRPVPVAAWLFVVVLGLAGAASGRAFAQPVSDVRGPEASAGEALAQADAEYRQLVDDGVAEFGRGNWSEARAFFSRAHQLKPSARTLRGLGLVAYELRNYVEAESLLARALVEPVQPLTAELRAETENTLARARALIGRFRVRVAPADARLWVDGHEAELRDGMLALDAGAHEIAAQRAGFVDGKLRVDVHGGESEDLGLSLRPVPSLAVPGPPAAATDARAGARVSAQTGERGREDRDDSSIFESPWLWAAIAVLAAGGTAAALVLTADVPDPEPMKPTSGMVFVALTVDR
jgi:hypothetical protein